MIEHEQVCYIDDNPNKGIIVNFGKARKAYKKVIKASAGKLYDPTTIPFEKIRYAVLMSTRKTGKTNTNLLIALILWQMYGVTTAYVRQLESEITYNEIKSFFDVLRSFNYAAIVTGDEYTDFEIRGSYGYLVHYDDRMKIDKRSDPFVWFGAIFDISMWVQKV